MTTIESIFSKNTPEPLGHYSQAVRADGLIHVSGQLPIKAGDQNIASSLPFEQQAHLVLRNLLSILDAAGAGPRDVVKVTAYIVGVGQWGIFNAAFAEAFGDIFGDIIGSDLTISADGSVTGTVSAERVNVYGRIEGQIRAVTLIVHPTAHVEAENCLSNT